MKNSEKEAVVKTLLTSISHWPNIFIRGQKEITSAREVYVIATPTKANGAAQVSLDTFENLVRDICDLHDELTLWVGKDAISIEKFNPGIRGQVMYTHKLGVKQAT